MFNYGDIQNNIFTQDKELNIPIYIDHLSATSSTGIIDFKNGPVFTALHGMQRGLNVPI